MTSYCYDLSYFKKSDAFQNQSEIVQFIIIEMISESKQLGAWELKSRLSEIGLDTSTATIGRHLKDLDMKNLTVKIGNKGRTLTLKGEKYLEETLLLVTSNILHRNMQEVIKKSEYGSLLDIYAVRIPVEIESVRLCCKNANEAQLAKISSCVQDYMSLSVKGNTCIDASLDFHTAISEATQNQFLDAILKMLIFEQKKIENALEFVNTRRHLQEFAADHRDIYEAVKNRDDKTAMEFMRNHFNKIVNVLNEKAEE
ncbi:MAG: FCD domain-containing protein [Bacillota bacterium]|nr:FCD domain-containing protein [Bacillota bacterium]